MRTTAGWGALVAFLAALLAGVWAAPDDARAAAFVVTIDTTSLAGADVQLEFDLFGFDDVDDNNSATIAGILPAPEILTDAGGLGQLLHEITLADSLSFSLDLTTNFAGGPGGPDRFALFLLDPLTSFSLVDTDLEGDALLLIDLVGPPVVQVAGVTTPPVTVVVTSAVPGPSTGALMGIAVFALLASRSFRSTRRPSRPA